jgi:hypothetical protein
MAPATIPPQLAALVAGLLDHVGDIVRAVCWGEPGENPSGDSFLAKKDFFPDPLLFLRSRPEHFDPLRLWFAIVLKVRGHLLLNVIKNGNVDGIKSSSIAFRNGTLHLVFPALI